jgi:hypothetical protein
MKRINDFKIGTRLNLVFNLAFVAIVDISVILTPLIGLIQRTDVKLTILPISIFS